MEWSHKGKKGGAMMGWTEPKTGWKSDDRFNISDYNRIKGNIEYLHSLAQELYRYFPIPELGEDKLDYADYFYAREFNNMEDSLEKINKIIYSQNIGEKQIFVDNGVFIDWKELNRLESASLKIYELLNTQKALLPRMNFRLGNVKGVRV